MDPRHKVVLLTGASAGIGAATAREFAQAGARLALVARNRDALERLAAELPGQALVVPTDVSSASQCQALVARVLEHWQQVDILINNAGIGLAGPVADLNPDDLERTLGVDLFGPLYLTQAVLPGMRARRSGQIINISSVLAAQPLPYLGGYAAAKAALERMSESLRMELRGTGVAVSVVRPGTTQTAFRTNRLGAGHERRRVAPTGVPPAAVARAVLRAARREPRRAYVRLTDRLALWASALVPALVERALSGAISWEGKR